MKIIVVFAPWFENEVNLRRRIMEVQTGTSVGDLIKMLALEYGGEFNKVLPETKEYPGILLIHNGQVTLDTSEILSDGDEIGFAIPLDGG